MPARGAPDGGTRWAFDGCFWLPWGWLLLAYALAKACEQFDREIWAMTEGLVAGHPLKHLIAALGVVPLLRVLRARRR